MLIEFQAESFGKTSLEGRVRTAFQDVPIRIMIGRVDLLGYVKESADEPPDFRWATLQPIDVATWGLYAIKRAREDGQHVYELGRHGDTGTAMLFKMSGEDVLIHSTMTDKTVRISYRRLVEEWEAFADRVRDCVLQEFPEMKEVPGWSEWLIEKKDVPWGASGIKAEVFPLWRMWFDEKPHALDHIDAVEE